MFYRFNFNRDCCEFREREEIGHLFMEMRLDEASLRGKEEINFGKIGVLNSGWGNRGRAREGVAGLLNSSLCKYVKKAKGTNKKIMFVRLRIKRECWSMYFYSPGREKDMGRKRKILECYKEV